MRYCNAHGGRRSHCRDNSGIVGPTINTDPGDAVCSGIMEQAKETDWVDSCPFCINSNREMDVYAPA